MILLWIPVGLLALLLLFIGNLASDLAECLDNLTNRCERAVDALAEWMRRFDQP